jgi:hypothetical protein
MPGVCRVVTPLACADCGAERLDGRNCEDDFHTLLGWEHERTELMQVYHLTVLAYHLQHPHLYSPEGLAYSRRLLADFLVGLTPTLARARGAAMLNSRGRRWKVTGTAESYGSYSVRPEWRMTVADVVAGGIDEYRERAAYWARTVNTSLNRTNAISA